MAKLIRNKEGHLVFTKEMKKDYKILLPQMLPIHFDLIEESLKLQGFNVEILKTDDFQKIAGTGTKYIHNDMCVPAILVIGQMIDALQSGKYDTDKVALAITQTGGGCRASNYIHLLRKGLEKAGLSHIPVVSLNIGGMEKNPGFKLKLKTWKRMVYSLILGDVIMWCSNRQRAYEVNKGETVSLVEQVRTELKEKMSRGRWLKGKNVRKEIYDIVERFGNIQVDMSKPVPRVGVVGEVYVKFAPLGNNNLEDFLRSEGCEVVVPGLTDFMVFKVDNRIEDIKLYGGKWLKNFILHKAKNYFTKYQMTFIDAVQTKGKDIPVPSNYEHLKTLVDGYVGRGNKMGEGWMLTAEMLELIEAGIPNIVCTQPFGCLPNHIVGRGMFKMIKDNHPEANIIPIDYDPGATKVNQENRIKLMLSNAKESIKNKGAKK